MINIIKKVILVLLEVSTLFTLFSNEKDIPLFNKKSDISNFTMYYTTDFDSDVTYINNIISVGSEVYLTGESENLISPTSKMDSFITRINSDGKEDKNWKLTIDTNLGRDTINGICIDSKGNIYISGYYKSKDMQYGVWIKKLQRSNKEPVILWEKEIGLNNESPFLITNALQVDDDDNLFLITTDKNNWVIKKFDTNGNEDTQNWNKRVGDTQGLHWPKDIAIDNSGNVYIVGVIQNIESDELDFDWLIKVYNNDGIENTSWNKQIDGNNKWDKPFSIEINNSEIYISGYGSNLLSTSSDYDWWIKKFTLTGREVWNRVIGRNNNKETIVSTKFYKDSFLIAGTDSEDHIWGIKSLDTNGEVKKDILSNNDNIDGFYTITDFAVTDDGFVYISGVFYYKDSGKFKSKGYIRKYYNRKS